MAGTTPAAIKERKTFLADFAERENLFFKNLALSLKEEGFLISEKNVRGVYTVSTQLFHRLWWDGSRNRSERYKRSCQGISYLDLFLVYRKLRDFPLCVSAICETLHDRLVIKAHELCKTLEVYSSDALIKAKELIGDELRNEFASLDTVIENIFLIKGGHFMSKWEEKNSLKKKSIQKILIPIIWNNLLEDFISNPSNFVRF